MKTIVVRSAVRRILKKEKQRILTSAFVEVEREVRSLILKAGRRAALSGRKTVLPQDI